MTKWVNELSDDEKIDLAEKYIEETKMNGNEKYMCVECGENEVDDEDDICDDCAIAYGEKDDGDDE